MPKVPSLLFLFALFCASPTSGALPPASSVVTTMEHVLGHYMSHASEAELRHCSCFHSALMHGVMSLWSVTNNMSHLGIMMQWAEARQWTVCDYDEVLTDKDWADDVSCGQAYAEAYLHHSQNATYIRNITDVLNVLVRRPNVDAWYLEDDFFMAMGTFARIGHITGDVRFHDKSYALYNDSALRRGLWVEDFPIAGGGLYWRDASFKGLTSPNGEPVFWARGTAWAVGGLCRALDFTPTSHPARAVYIAHLSRAVAALRVVQGPDGMWRSSLFDMTQFPNPESSGTSGILFAIAWGINNGILDRGTYLPVVTAAWEGLTSLAVHSDGLLGYCQGDSAKGLPGIGPANATMTFDYCVGLFLLAAGEVVKLAAP